jgi:hypothetical protein
MAAEQPGRPEDIPPPLGTWQRLYVLVLGALAFEIALLWLLAKAFG